MEHRTKKESKLIIAQRQIILPNNVQKKEDELSVIPKKDFVLIDGYKQIQMKMGVSVNIPSKFKSSLESENVI